MLADGAPQCAQGLDEAMALRTVALEDAQAARETVGVLQVCLNLLMR